MIELLQHTEALLLENDCVIIPSFGGFVSHYTPARWVEDEGLFLPPTRSIGFNPQLKMNDGLLIQSYMSAYDTDYSDAAKLVDKATKEFVENLHQEDIIEMHGIGNMSLTIHNTLQFEPFENGLLTPGLYGLSSFEIGELKEEIIVAKEEEEAELRIPNPEVYEFRINRSYIRTAISIAAAVIIFFFMSTPIENTYIEKANYAELIPSQLLQLPINNGNTIVTTDSPKETESEEVEIAKPVNTDKDLSATKIKDNNQIKPKAIKQISVPKKKTVEEKKDIPSTTLPSKGIYHIIAASSVSRSGAEALVKKLKNSGFAEASIIENNGKVRVSILSLSDNKEANQKLNQIKKNDAYKDAWLLTAK